MSSTRSYSPLKSLHLQSQVQKLHFQLLPIQQTKQTSNGAQTNQIIGVPPLPHMHLLATKIGIHQHPIMVIHQWTQINASKSAATIFHLDLIKASIRSVASKDIKPRDVPHFKCFPFNPLPLHPHLPTTQLLLGSHELTLCEQHITKPELVTRQWRLSSCHNWSKQSVSSLTLQRNRWCYDRGWYRSLHDTHGLHYSLLSIINFHFIWCSLCPNHEKKLNFHFLVLHH